MKTDLLNLTNITAALAALANETASQLFPTSPGAVTVSVLRPDDSRSLIAPVASTTLYRGWYAPEAAHALAARTILQVGLNEILAIKASSVLPCRACNGIVEVAGDLYAQFTLPFGRTRDEPYPEDLLALVCARIIDHSVDEDTTRLPPPTRVSILEIEEWRHLPNRERFDRTTKDRTWRQSVEPLIEAANAALRAFVG